MTDYYRCEPQGTPEEIHAWALFEKRLGAYLSTMIDPSDEDRLTLFVPTPIDGGTHWPVVISAADGGTSLRIDYGWDDTGCAPDDLGDMPWRIGETIRFRFKLHRVDLISATASGPAAIGLPILGLADHDAITEGDAESAGEPERADWVVPETRDEMMALVLSHVRAEEDPDTKPDDDDEVPVVRHGLHAWITVHSGSPVLTIWTMALPRVRSRTQADIELSILNRRHTWSRWVRVGDRIIQRATIPASPFNPQILGELIDDFFDRAVTITPDLVDRVGGTDEVEIG